MKNKTFRYYYILSMICILTASSYPLYMGVKVVTDMIQNGTVLAEDYPKYIIPYTPICLAIIIGTLILPLALKFFKRFALIVSSAVSVGVFFLSELMLESKVIVTETIETTLESWQMYMCVAKPQSYETRTWTESNILIGEYSPLFKLHFYIISIVLILSLLSCIYGFGRMIQSGDKSKKQTLILQTIASITFLVLCILACFTAFYRTGELQVSIISAILMIVFFVLFGLTTGIYTGSFLYRKNKWISVMLPSVVASAVTFIMYIGEMILLHSHLYRFGTGVFFEAFGGIVFAPVDIVVILLSGIICLLLLWKFNSYNRHGDTQ